jgi:peptide-methionine (S)-S-oxide reductase
MAERQVAVLGGGCFWCLDAIFREVSGAVSVVAGYCGGSVASPDYHAVCGGRTGHAEVVRVEFDPVRVSFRQLLEIFFVIHDPTTHNRQGNDVGTQYRSVIFAQSDAQREVARTLIDELAAAQAYGAPILTELLDAQPFWPAEREHQDYFARNPGQPYCHFVIAPKLEKFRKHFDALRST